MPVEVRLLRAVSDSISTDTFRCRKDVRLILAHACVHQILGGEWGLSLLHNDR